MYATRQQATAILLSCVKPNRLTDSLTYVQGKTCPRWYLTSRAWQMWFTED